MISTENKTSVAIQELENKESLLLKHLGKIASAPITNEREQKNAEDILIGLRSAVREAEEVRMGITAPLDMAKGRVVALFRPYTDRLKAGIANVNTALTAYHAKVVAQQEEERMARLAEEAARLSELNEVSNLTGEVVEIRPIDDIAPPPSKRSRTNTGTVSYREDIDVAVINPDLVPRDLCMPDMARIRARARSGVTDIPGVVIRKKYIPVAKRAAR